MKKFKILAMSVIAGLGFASCTSDAEYAQQTAEQFWSAVQRHTYDSVTILYPDFEKLGLPKTELKCTSATTLFTKEVGEKCFEVSSKLELPGDERTIEASLLIKKGDGKKFIVYDSRNLVQHSEDDCELLQTLGYVDEGDIYLLTTDQDRAYAVDSALPKLKEAIIDSILVELKEGLTIRTSKAYNQQNEVWIKNNTRYNIKKGVFTFKSNYRCKYCDSYNSNGEWKLTITAKPGATYNRSLTDGWGYYVFLGNKRSLTTTRKEAWKMYEPTGTEWNDYKGKY